LSDEPCTVKTSFSSTCGLKGFPHIGSFQDIIMLHMMCALAYPATSWATQNYVHNLLSLFYLFANVRLSWKYLLTMIEIM